MTPVFRAVRHALSLKTREDPATSTSSGAHHAGVVDLLLQSGLPALRGVLLCDKNAGMREYTARDQLSSGTAYLFLE